MKAHTLRSTPRLSQRCRQLRTRLPAAPLLGGWLLVAGLIGAAPAARASTTASTFGAMVATFQRYGFEVVGNHPRCLQERNLFGLYQRGSRRIIVCPRGNQLDTLMHEGWHGVQARCRKGQPLLTTQFLRASLSRADLRDIDALYRDASWHREAEARVMAQQKIPLYLAHLESSCGAPPSAAGATPAPPLTPPLAQPAPAQPGIRQAR